MSGLVNRRRRQTRAEIFDAAMTVFEEREFEVATMEDVAAAAGVSRRTIYRHFETKEDLVFEPPREWVEVLDAALATRRTDESTRDAYRRAMLDVAGHILADADRVLRAYAILQSSPALLSRHGRIDSEWAARLFDLIGSDVGDDAADELAGATAAMSIFGAGHAVIRVWARRGGRDDLVAMTESVLDQVDAVWPEACR